MIEQTTATAKTVKPTQPQSSSQEDSSIMKKIRIICGRGNNAEVKQKKDGTLTVMEVKKNIV